jgi:hypothetical protein
MNGSTSSNGNTVMVENYIGGKFVAPISGEYLDVVNPSNLHVIGRVGVSNAADVDFAVSVAKAALPAWSTLTMKARAALVSQCCQEDMRPFLFTSSVCLTLVADDHVDFFLSKLILLCSFVCQLCKRC